MHLNNNATLEYLYILVFVLFKLLESVEYVPDEMLTVVCPYVVWLYRNSSTALSLPCSI